MLCSELYTESWLCFSFGIKTASLKLVILYLLFENIILFSYTLLWETLIYSAACNPFTIQFIMYKISSSVHFLSYSFLFCLIYSKVLSPCSSISIIFLSTSPGSTSIPRLLSTSNTFAAYRAAIFSEFGLYCKVYSIEISLWILVSFSSVILINLSDNNFLFVLLNVV